MRPVCITCGKSSDNKKDFFEVTASVGPNHICKDCASELGIHNFFSAGIHSNTSLLKKYVKIHPEAQYRLDEQMNRISGMRQEMKQELHQMKKQLDSNVDGAAQKFQYMNRHSGCIKKEQTKCQCCSCNFIFYYSDLEVQKNITNFLHGTNIYTLNQLKDLDQCPKCGNRAITKKKVYFWVDKKGNCVDMEE